MEGQRTGDAFKKIVQVGLPYQEVAEKKSAHDVLVLIGPNTKETLRNEKIIGT